MRWLYLLVIISISAMTSYGQSSRKVTAEYVYAVPNNISQDAAREIALYRAKIKVIAEEYGTNISQNNFTNVTNGTNSSSIDFQAISSSEIKGEWIETIGEPKYDYSFEQGMLMIKVKVAGRIRPIDYARVEFTSMILCNGTTDKFSSSRFKSGDDLYIKFRSPQNGYLAIYIIDNNRQVFCLLPYQNAPNGIYEVKKGVDYTLFSAEHYPNENYIDEYILTSDGQSEVNQIYTIFSPNKFIKSDDSFFNDLMPRQLTFEKFQEWLSKNRKRDTDMQVQINSITIE